MSRYHQQHQSYDANASSTAAGVFTAVPIGAPSHPTASLASLELPLSLSGGGRSGASFASSTGIGSLSATAAIPMVPTPHWDPSRPFAFARRTRKMDWDRILSLDLASIVASRDLSTLQSITEQLVFADITQEDLAYFESDPLVQQAGVQGKGNGVANFLHLFRLWQLTGEALLHVQGFLLRSLQAKEGATAVVREKYAAKVEAERAANTVLKARLGAAQAEIKQARATIAGYERAGARGMPVYLPHQAPQGTAQYPGEVFACAICSSAFTSAHYLDQHYLRRHAGIPNQNHHTLPKQPPQEEKEPAPYQPKFDANALAALRAELTASITAQMDAQWTRRRQEEHHRLLSRLHALESLLASQFADQTIPASMEASQRRIYESILREVESIKLDLAREGNDFTMPPPIGLPHWTVEQQQQPQQPPPKPATRPVTPARTPKQSPVEQSAGAAAVAPLVLDEPVRPARVSVPSSPANSNPAYSPTPRTVTPAVSRPRTPPAPAPALDPSSLSHLPREERLRHALLARDGYGSYAPFPELPWLRSRYGVGEWIPAPSVQMEAVARRVEALCTTGEEAKVAELEEHMHSMETAADSYNSLHHTVEERLAAYMPTPQWMLDANEHLDRRVEFLSQWERLIADKETREALRAARAAAEQAEREQREAEEKAEAERAAAAARQLEAENAARAAAAEHKMTEHERMVQEQRRMLIQHEFARAQAAQAAALRASSGAVTPTPTSAAAGGGGFPKEGLPFIDTGVSPSNALASSQTNPMGGEGIMLRRGLSARSSSSGSGEASDMGSETVSTLSTSTALRPEGVTTPQAQATIMPRTPTTTRAAVPTLTPSMRQAMAQQMQQQQTMQLGPSPSASFSSAAGSSFGSAGGDASTSFGGASIMRRDGSGLGGLTHISEGPSIDDSELTALQSRSRRGSAEQEGKYNESTPASPAAAVRTAVVVPRTPLDEEFEQMLSPKRVAPRTQPPLIVAPSASPIAAAKFMAAPSTTNSTLQSPSMVQPYSSNTTNPQPLQQLLRLPSAQLQFGRTPLASDRNSQPGAFTYAGAPGGMPAQTPYAQTPGAAPTPQPGAASHTVRIGGHGFTFSNTPAHAASSSSAAAARGRIAEGVESLEDVEDDKFPLSNDALASQAESRAAAAAAAASIAEAQRLQAEQDRKQRETEQARREEAEAFGVPSVLQRGAAQPTAQLQQQHSLAPSSLASSRGLNDSLEEMVLADEPARAPTVTITMPSPQSQPQQAQAQQFQPRPQSLNHDQQQQQQHQQHRPAQFLGVDTAAAGRVPASVRQGELTPAPYSMEVTPSPGGIAYQQRNNSGNAAASGFLSSRVASSAAAPQPFASPASSINAVQPFTASPSVAASPAAPPSIQPVSFQQSQPAPALQQHSRGGTFISDFSDDEFARSSGSTMAAASSAAAAVPAISSFSAARPANAADNPDEFADLLDSDDDAEIYGRGGRAPAKQGTAVIAQGSVASARAQLLGSGTFFPATPSAAAAGGQHHSGFTPSMAALKAAKAAREAAEAAASGGAAASVESPVEELSSSQSQSLLSPTLSRPKSMAARKGASRAARPMFSPTASG